MTATELQILSRGFRRISSDLMMCDDDNCESLVRRFFNFITTDPYISDMLTKYIEGHEIDRSEFLRYSGYWIEIVPPIDHRLHIRAAFDLLSSICSGNETIYDLSLRYSADGSITHRERKLIEVIIKPIYDFINDSIVEDILKMGTSESKPSITIQANYGSVNSASRDIHSQNTVNVNTNTAEILPLFDKLFSSLETLSLDATLKEEVKDDLESIKEQLESHAPKKTRISKALDGLKDFTSKALVGIAVHAATQADWSLFISQVGAFLSTLP